MTSLLDLEKPIIAKVTGGAIMGESQYRGMDLLSPLWHYFDLLPIGRGDWNPKHAY